MAKKQESFKKVTITASIKYKNNYNEYLIQNSILNFISILAMKNLAFSGSTGPERFIKIDIKGIEFNDHSSFLNRLLGCQDMTYNPQLFLKQINELPFIKVNLKK